MWPCPSTGIKERRDLQQMHSIHWSRASKYLHQPTIMCTTKKSLQLKAAMFQLKKILIVSMILALSSTNSVSACQDLENRLCLCFFVRAWLWMDLLRWDMQQRLIIIGMCIQVLQCYTYNHFVISRCKQCLQFLKLLLCLYLMINLLLYFLFLHNA